jgi:molybdenum cofactor cytidylyltransferase
VLAAGKSSRMGRNKLLLPFYGQTVLGTLLDALKTPLLSEVIVVTGNKPEEITEIIESHSARRAHNPRFEEGMTTSVQAGFKAAGGADGVFLVLGDQLGTRAPELLRRMAAAMEDATGTLIVSPIYGGRRGHPVLFSSSLSAEILALTGTLKEVVDRHAAAHVQVEGGEWSTVDFDTPADFERAKRLFEK